MNPCTSAIIDDFPLHQFPQHLDRSCHKSAELKISLRRISSLSYIATVDFYDAFKYPHPSLDLIVQHLLDPRRQIPPSRHPAIRPPRPPGRRRRRRRRLRDRKRRRRCVAIGGMRFTILHGLLRLFLPLLLLLYKTPPPQNQRSALLHGRNKQRDKSEK